MIGNPPFIGSKRMRESLGDGYVDALQAAWPDVPEATDFVMRWWHHAAGLVRAGKVRRFGFITTNSLRQTYVRRAVEPHLSGSPPMSLVYAVANHPWVDAADGAAVRVSMTVGERGQREGRVLHVVRERESGTDTDDDLVALLKEDVGTIHANLTVGANLTRAEPIAANLGLCSVGMKTIGASFQVDRAQAERLGLGSVAGIDKHIQGPLVGDWPSAAAVPCCGRRAAALHRDS